VWLFLWDDAIDGAGAGAEAEAEGLLAEEYCRQSVAFVEYHLGIVGRREADASEPPAPTAVCASFAEVGGRVAGYAGPEDRGVLGQHLREYMEACVTEHRWRLSGRVPSVEEFYSWRLRTSSVDVMLDLSRLVLPSWHESEFLAGIDVDGTQDPERAISSRGDTRVKRAGRYGPQSEQTSDPVSWPT
jgi:hypothetical protein